MMPPWVIISLAWLKIKACMHTMFLCCDTFPQGSIFAQSNNHIFPNVHGVYHRGVLMQVQEDNVLQQFVSNITWKCPALQT